DVSVQDQGFNSDNNALHLYWSNGDKALPLAAKSELGLQLINEIINLYQQAKQ
ncbi:phosphopantothenoylcysteine synthase/decarboxylase [Vibrio angustum S14]|nr:phosphopantothenoylcysteine synthase/decarboxylase [Vibrio angustum S14] [Photobacterium angustum S14]